MGNLLHTDEQRLCHSARSGDLNDVQSLLDSGISPDSRDDKNKNQTALMACCQWDKLSVGFLLLHCGANPNLLDNSSNSALILAAKTGSVQLCKALLQHHAKVRVNQATKNGKTALFKAAFQGHREVVLLLLKARADTEIACLSAPMEGWTPLHASAYRGFPNICADLIASGAVLDAIDVYGDSPLHISVREGHQEVLCVLKDAGADLSVKNGKGDTALTLAQKAGRYDLVTCLEQGSDFSPAC